MLEYSIPDKCLLALNPSNAGKVTVAQNSLFHFGTVRIVRKYFHYVELFFCPFVCAFGVMEISLFFLQQNNSPAVYRWLTHPTQEVLFPQ